MSYITLACFMLGYFFMVLDFLIIIPSLAHIFSISGDNPFDHPLANNATLFVALNYGFYFIGAGIFSPYFGALSDWLGRKKLILCSLIGMALGYFLAWFGILWGSLFLFGFARFFCGAFGAYRALVFTSLSDISKDPATRVRYFGIFSIIDAFLWFVFFLIGASIFSPKGYLFLGASLSSPFLIAAIVLLLTAALVWINFEDPFKPLKEGGPLSCLKGYSHFFQHTFKHYFLFTLFFLGIGSFVHIQRSYFLNFTESPVDVLLICFLLFAVLWSIASASVLPKIIQKMEMRKIAFFSFLTLTLLWLIVPLSPNLGIYFILILIFGLSIGFLWPLSFLLISLKYPMEKQGKAQAITLSIYSFTALITAYLPFKTELVVIQAIMIILLGIGTLVALTLPKNHPGKE